MRRLLHISDPHFGTVQPPVMEALVALAHEQRPDVLVLSGDITQRARTEQFEQARAFCDRLDIACVLTLPGNHDIPLFNLYQRLFRPYSRYLRAFGPSLEGSLQTPWLQVISAKTTRRWRHTNGEISAAQIARVVEQLAQARPSQVRVVVVHQPVYVTRPQDEHDRLRGWEPAVRAWSAAGADIVMGGHIHLPYVCELSGELAGLERRLWCVQAGTALSSRVRWEAPNSVNLLHCSEDSLQA
ncbi:MAG: metallophosphoesterase, partial [Polaromonas sp.]